MPSTRSAYSRQGLLRQKRMRELKIALILGLICAGLAALGIYLLQWLQRF